MALRHYGTTALRHYDTTALWQYGTTALWHYVTTELRNQEYQEYQQQKRDGPTYLILVIFFHNRILGQENFPLKSA